MERRTPLCGNQAIPQMEQTMIITNEMKKMKSSMIWGFVNAAVLSIVLYDIFYSCSLYTSAGKVIENIVAVFLALNTLFHFSRYIWISLTLKPVSLSPRQKSLLGIKHDAQTQSGMGPGNEAGSLSQYQYADVWRKMEINPSYLTEWTANLRMWISQTILERLVSEIQHIDTSLHAQGLVDITVGVVGLERLKKTAQIPQVMLNIPRLARLVPFLEISQNQEYVVSRIKDLARCGCMSRYQWSSGGEWEGKVWTPALPTDAALVLHLLATYLDSQLPQTSLPDSRPFSSQHVVRLPDKPPPCQLCIVETSTAPPNYHLQTKTEIFHPLKGRNNLFFTILFFLHIVKTRDHGILGGMNLGRSGINLLWVIDSES